jgi:hypothetical protein
MLTLRSLLPSRLPVFTAAIMLRLVTVSMLLLPGAALRPLPPAAVLVG